MQYQFPRGNYGLAVEKSTGQYRGYLAIPLADVNSGTEDDESGIEPQQ